MTVHRKKAVEHGAMVRHAEHATKPKKLAKPAAQKPDAGYVLSPKSHTNIGIGQMRPHQMPSITTGSSEAYLMQSALGRLDKAIGAYETQVKAVESEPTRYLADHELLKPLTNALREVQGQLDSCTHHAETWLKDQPAKLSEVKGRLREYNTRFEALTNRANKAGDLKLLLHPPLVPQRY